MLLPSDSRSAHDLLTEKFHARLATRCCGHWPYRLAKDNLAELCQIYLYATTIGNIADRTSRQN